MSARFAFPLLEDPGELSAYEGWSRETYEDLMAVAAGRMTREAFDARHLGRGAVLVLDITGFTASTLEGGAISSFLRILDTHKICFPILREKGASFIRAFADDLVALFDDCAIALDAALEIHERMSAFETTEHGHRYPPECCIGIGYGDIYRIGPNHAMGDEMNQASVLGEDIARGGETLVTEGARSALAHRSDVHFAPQTHDDLLFPYSRVERV